MKIIRSLAELPLDTQHSIITIGNFDGVHRGHQMVIANVIERARILGVKSIAVTFDPHPAYVLGKATGLKLITPLPQKLELLAQTGIDLTVVLPFTKELSGWSAFDFAKQVLADGLRAVEVHEGETFRFGHNAETGTEGLAQLGEQLGFAVRTYHPLILRGAPVSSSRIRSLIAAGDMAQARALLSRTFAVQSTPASGRGYGTLYTVPTINLAPYSDLLPANGVYITTLKVGEGTSARTFRGVTNAGNRPTFGADSFAVETHLLDFEPIALTEFTPLEMAFLKRLRAEQRFDSPEALRAQISQDVRHAKRYFAFCNTISAVKPQPASTH